MAAGCFLTPAEAMLLVIEEAEPGVKGRAALPNNQARPRMQTGSSRCARISSSKLVAKSFRAGVIGSLFIQRVRSVSPVTVFGCGQDRETRSSRRLPGGDLVR